MRPMPELKVETVSIDKLNLNPLNSKLHPADQIDQIAESIETFGNCDPLGVWTNDAGELVIVEGHGRYAALKKLGITEVPIIRLDHLSDEQRRAYGLVHNKLTMNSDFDMDILSNELEAITSIDMENFGFVTDNPDELEENPYTDKADVPQYEIEGEDWPINELFDDGFQRQLAEEIDDAEGITDQERTFLKRASERHVRFDYRRIAEYYAQASKEFQRLAERSALVIIDVDDAIANGYAKLARSVSELREG